MTLHPQALSMGKVINETYNTPMPYIFSVSTDVVSCFRIICTLGEPFSDGGAVRGSMVHLPTLET